jgi:hypothetical protein
MIRDLQRSFFDYNRDEHMTIDKVMMIAGSWDNDDGMKPPAPQQPSSHWAGRRVRGPVSQFVRGRKMKENKMNVLN